MKSHQNIFTNEVICVSNGSSRFCNREPRIQKSTRECSPHEIFIHSSSSYRHYVRETWSPSCAKYIWGAKLIGRMEVLRPIRISQIFDGRSVCLSLLGRSVCLSLLGLLLIWRHDLYLYRCTVSPIVYLNNKQTNKQTNARIHVIR